MLDIVVWVLLGFWALLFFGLLATALLLMEHGWNRLDWLLGGFFFLLPPLAALYYFFG